MYLGRFGICTIINSWNIHATNIYCVRHCSKQEQYCSKEKKVPNATGLISSGRADRKIDICQIVIGTLKKIKVDKEKRVPEDIILVRMVRKVLFKGVRFEQRFTWSAGKPCKELGEISGRACKYREPVVGMSLTYLKALQEAKLSSSCDERS